MNKNGSQISLNLETCFFVVQDSLPSFLFEKKYITAARLSLTRDTEPLFLEMAQSRESWFNS